MHFDRIRVDRMIAKMDAWLTQREQEQKSRQDAEDRERDITNPLEAPTNAPFSDCPPAKIHGQGREDQDFWGPPKPKPPIPIEHI